MYDYIWRNMYFTIRKLSEVNNVISGEAGILRRMECGEPLQAWKMWLSPHSEKPVGSEVGGQDPRPWTGSPVGNQACIIPSLL